VQVVAVTEIRVAQTPQQLAVVPCLIAATDVRVNQRWNVIEAVETAPVDRYNMEKRSTP